MKMTSQALVSQGTQKVVFRTTEETSKKRKGHGISIDQGQKIGIVEAIDRVPDFPTHVEVMNLCRKIITTINVKQV